MVTVTPTSGQYQLGWVIAALIVASILCIAGMVFGNSVLLNPPEAKQDAISTGTFYGLALTATGNALNNEATATRQAHNATQAAAVATALPVEQTLQAAQYWANSTTQAYSNNLKSTQAAEAARDEAESRQYTTDLNEIVGYFILFLAAGAGFVIVAIGTATFFRQALAIYRQEVEIRRLEAEVHLLDARTAKLNAEAKRVAEHRRLTELRDRQRARAVRPTTQPFASKEEHPYLVGNLATHSLSMDDTQPHSRDK